MLSLDDIKKAEDIKTQSIFVPEWNGKVVLKGITEEEDRACRKVAINFNKDNEQYLDESKYRIFKLIRGMLEPNLDDGAYTWLRQKSHFTLERLLAYIDILSIGGEIIDPISQIPEKVKEKEKEEFLKDSKDELKKTFNIDSDDDISGSK